MGPQGGQSGAHLDYRHTSQVISVLPDAAIVGAVSLALRHVGETMFNGDALAKLLPALGGRHTSAQRLLEDLVFRDVNRASAAPRRVGAL